MTVLSSLTDVPACMHDSRNSTGHEKHEQLGLLHSLLPHEERDDGSMSVTDGRGCDMQV
jgi:hypothetical protein